MVPRDGIEPPKNLDINGLDTAFCADSTSIPDKIPDKTRKTRAETRAGEATLLSLSQQFLARYIRTQFEKMNSFGSLDD